MSFGVGAGDIAVVTTLAWQTYQSCKNSSEILKDLSSDVASLHVVWKHTLDFVQQGEVDEDRQEQLTTIERNSYDVLTDIESYSAKHESLASQSQPAWDHMEGGTEDVTSLKERVVCAAAQLTVFNTAVARFVDAHASIQQKRANRDFLAPLKRASKGSSRSCWQIAGLANVIAQSCPYIPLSLFRRKTQRLGEPYKKSWKRSV